MAAKLFRTVLVIGENPSEIIAQYNADTKVEPYYKLRFSEAADKQKAHIQLLEAILSSKDIPLTEHQKDIYKELLMDVKGCDPIEYFYLMTDGCEYDEEGALTQENPQAFYKSIQDPQNHLLKVGDEHDFCDPFHLVNGDISYSAKKSEIDWSRMHMYNMDLYARCWEMCVEGSKPTNEQEEGIFDRMKNRESYFALFDSKEDYVRHSTSFWCYGCADGENYTEVDYKVSDKEWVKGFYEKFIEPLPDDALLSLYVVRSLDN